MILLCCLILSYVGEVHMAGSLQSQQCFKKNHIYSVKDFTEFAKSCDNVLGERLSRFPGTLDAEYMGCYWNSLMATQMLYFIFNASQQTIHRCIWTCRSYYMPYAGVENGQECYCGISNNSSAVVPDAKCDIECMDDFRYTCGGKGKIQVYSTRTKRKYGWRTIAKGKYIGCFPENEDGLLSGYPIRQPNMTVEYCLDHCYGLRYFYAGLKQSDSCICGNDTVTESKVSNKKCPLRCLGNLTYHCGGFRHLQLYRTLVPMPSRIPNWNRNGVYLGCYEQVENGKYLLPLMRKNVRMTLEYCLEVCGQFGKRNAGVEGLDCYCGALQGKSSKVRDHFCNSGCTGNPKAFCGGRGVNKLYLQIYQFVDPMGHVSSLGMYVGCFEGQIDNRLFKRKKKDVSMTIDKCVVHCQQEGYWFAGVENRIFCACAQLYGDHPETTSGECSQQCPGNKSQFCGNQNRLQIHSVATPPRRFSPFGVYIGCFTSLATNMKSVSHKSQKMSLLSCMKFCWNQGFYYVGLSKGSTCFCGDTYSSDSKTADEGCSLECSLKNGDYCGGEWAYQIYTTQFLFRKFYYRAKVLLLPSDLARL